MDIATRNPNPFDNPATWLTLAWLDAGGGVRVDGVRRAMVVLPYRDRLVLLAPYLQQLVMESLGKRVSRSGAAIHHGLTVFGRKGSTDQHAYLQQLREGPDDNFVTFVEVLANGRDIVVGEGVTAGDILSGYLAGTRHALAEVGRRTLTLTMERLDARSLGALIALFERAVGLYASVVDINAYHQPGVEAGKRAASAIVILQGQILALLASGAKGSAAELAPALGAEPADVFHILRHLAANGRARLIDGTGHGRRFEAETSESALIPGG